MSNFNPEASPAALALCVIAVGNSVTPSQGEWSLDGDEFSPRGIPNYHTVKSADYPLAGFALTGYIHEDDARVMAAAKEMDKALQLFISQWNACGPNSGFGRYFSNVRDAALAATSYGKASTDRLQSKEVLLVSARIPLRCLACGNVVMTPRQEEEARAAHIATSACTECDPHGERHEQFYFTRDGRLLSYGQWMEHLEKPGASSATKAAVDLLEGNPEGSYGALVAGALLECRDLLSGMVGVVDLLLNRADLPVEVRNVLRSNHRIVDARAALNPAGPA